MPLFKITVLAAAVALGLAASASADPTLDHPSGEASCAGLFSVAERADIGIWPSRDRLNQIIQAYAASQGVSSGELYSGFAQDHQGVYAYCNLVSLGVPLP